ncbi:Pentatricopeptide repeat [Dillenia turbinata]|uniref:Pentatricopeptide repeat n=1 Tax=Dillenia turbinata TaxID=194707 RepID=A0AAN8ZEP2_9MAGN
MQLQQRRRLLSIAKAAIGFNLKYTTTTASPPNSSPQFASYYQKNAQEGIYSYNRRIDHLIKSGYLSSGIEVFDQMPVRDVVTWNLLISGHCRFGFLRQSLLIYQDMVSVGMRESSSTCSSILSVCSKAQFYHEGLQVHCRVVFLGFSLNIFVGCSLVDLYMHMGHVETGLKLMTDLPERNIATWNVVLRGFSEKGLSDGLLGLFKRMELDGVEPNQVSFCYLIRGCSNALLIEEGRQLHSQVLKKGLIEGNVFVANAMVDFYAACDNVIDAWKSFESIPEEDVISWNSIVSVFVSNGLLDEALELFNRMRLWGKRPSTRSFVGLLNFCSGVKDVIFGKQIHCYVLKLGFDHESEYVQSALIDMYGKCKVIKTAVCIFENVPERTLACCNSLMTSLLHCGVNEDVVELFCLMIDEGIGLNEVTISTTLKALSVSSLASFSNCRLVHSCATKAGLESDIVVSCSLIDAYSRSGHIEVSQKLFEQLPAPNVICYTSMIHGYARHGMGKECLEMLDKMINKGLKPDKVTILSVLTGCNHSGLVREGRLVFDSMRDIYGINPDQQHYSCMLDLLGRAGFLDEALELLRKAPLQNDPIMWSSILHSCRIHGNDVIGRKAAKYLMELEPEEPAVYLQAAKFYSAIGDFQTSTEVGEIALATKMRKEIGYSLIEVNGHIDH